MRSQLEHTARQAGYVLTDPLTQSGQSTLWRAVRSADQSAVLLKLPREATPSPQTLAAYHREFELLQSLDSVGVASPVALEVPEDSPVLVLEDRGPERSLEDLSLCSGPLPLERFFPLALSLAEAVGSLHQRGIVHNSIACTNILVAPDEQRIRLVGFDLATRLPEERFGLRANSSLIAHSLATISPEQTGRVNRSVDYRTDLYSLGAVLYRLLCGSLPFHADDASGWVFAHVAMNPAPLTERLPDLPPVVSAIVAKLLEKAPERRYQNAYGLQHDLLEAQDHGAAFELGRADRSGRFLLSEHLYGRERECAGLLKAFDRAATGARHAVLFAGYSGVGKTALVREVYRPMLDRGGFYASGKFDQHRRGIPYSAIQTAFRDLVFQLTDEPEEQREAWARQIRDELAGNLPVLTEVLPELELLVGPQPQPTPLGAADAQDRFQLVFRQLVRVFAKPAHPLILFLDDLQWIDLASLELVEALLSAQEVSHFLLIGAYRDNEVPAGHPLLDTVSRIPPDACTSIRLEPLPPEHLASLLRDSFGSVPEEEALALARLLHERTAGNPFFARQFLRLLYLEELLRFEFQSGRWICDLERAAGLGATENVVELMVRHLQRLDAPTLAVLSRAACLGNRFDLRTLALVEGLAPSRLHEQLWPTLEAGLLLPADQGRELREVGTLGAGLIDEHAAAICYAFLHDRVQQGAYSLLPEAERGDLHLRVGRLLRAELDEDELEQRIFEVVAHFEAALELLSTQEERHAIASLFALAAERARSSTAYTSAIRHAEIGLRLLGPEAWTLDYALALRLQRLLGECQGQQGAFELAEATLSTAAERCQTLLDRVAVLTPLMEIYVSNGRVAEALRTLIRILGAFGIQLDPESVHEVAAGAADAVAAARRGRSVQELVAAPEARDPEALALLRSLGSSIDTAYMSGHAWVIAVTSIAACTALEKGVTASASMVFSTYGLIAAEPETASGYALRHEYGAIGAQLAERFGDLAWISRSHVSNPQLYGAPFRQAVELKQRGVETGWASGAFTWGAYAELERLCMRITAGDPLQVLDEELQQRRVRVDQAKRVVCSLSLTLVGKFFAGLRGDAEDPVALGHDPQEALELQGAALAMGPYVASKWFSFKLLLASLFGHDELAQELKQQAAPHVHGLIGLPVEFLYRLACALTVASVPTHGPEERQAKLEELAALEGYFHEHAQVNPDYAPAAHLVRGLSAEARDTRHQAVEDYNRAVQAARERRQPHVEAVASERAGELALHMDRTQLAAFYLGEAQAAYRAWGAHAKAHELSVSYPTLLQHTPIAPPLPALSGSLRVGDTESLLKACLAISGELRLEELLSRQLQLLQENVGAQRGLLLLEQDGALAVAAESRLTEHGIETTLGEAELSAPTRRLVEHVWRSGESVSLDDAWDDTRFGIATRPEGQRPRSVLCLPILRTPAPAVVLYLDTRAAARGFTPAHHDTLRFLCAQATTSLQNALLVRDLQLEVEKRKRAHRDLASERDFWTRVIQRLPLVTCGLKPDGTTTFVNPAGCRVTGYSEDEIVGKSWWTLLYPGESYREVEALFHDLQTTAQVEGYEMTLVDKQGNPKLISWTSANLYDENEQLVSLVGFGLDITDRRRMELERETLQEQLRQAQKLETVGTMAGGIAHDFNNILTPILALGDLLQHQLRHLPDAAQDLKTIVQSAERARKLVSQILTFSSQRVEADLRSVSLQTLIAEVVDLLRASLPATIEIRQELDPSCPPVRANPDQLHQVLVNLATNAGHAMNGPGVLALRLSSADDRARIEVSDTGHGMDPETQQRVFEPFFTTKGVGQGTGLGLSVVHGIVRSHGGTITLESQPGRGTTFTIELPTALAAPLEPEEVAACPKAAGGRILLVDDEDLIVRLAVACLEDLGYDVLACPNSEEALEAFRREGDSFVAMLSDYTMPHMTGLTLASRVHELRPDLPIVLMTGRNPGFSDLELAHAGVVEVLPKPFRADDLGAVLARAIPTA